MAGCILGHSNKPHTVDERGRMIMKFKIFVFYCEDAKRAIQISAFTEDNAVEALKRKLPKQWQFYKLQLK